MILQRAETEILSSEQGTQFRIDINDTETFVQMLLNLYDNIHEAVVQEICSNALDANIEAKSDIPVITGINGGVWFCQDFGTGLSKDFMFSKYITIGYSSKKDNENLLGAYGLGRLTPLSYTTQYFVISNYEGIQTKYMIYLDGLKIRISELSSEPTEEPAGIRVEVPIKNDKGLWESAVKQRCAYFNIKSNLFKQWEILENDLVRWSSLNDNQEGLHVSLGNVKYDLDYRILNIPNFSLPFGIKIALNEGVLPTPSRSNIVYQESTKEILITKVKTFLNSFIDCFEEHWNKESEWKQIVIIRNGFYKINYLSEIKFHLSLIESIYQFLGRNNVMDSIKGSHYIWALVTESFKSVCKTSRFTSKHYLSESTLPKGFKTWFLRHKYGEIFKRENIDLDIVKKQYIYKDDNLDYLKDLSLYQDQYAKEFLLLDELFAEFEKSKQVAKKKETGYTTVRESESPASTYDWVYTLKDVSIGKLIKHYKYIVVFPKKDPILINKWYPYLKKLSCFIIINPKDSSLEPLKYKMIEIKDNFTEPSAILKRFCTQALIAQFFEELSIPQTEVVLDLVGKVNPIIPDYLTSLNFRAYNKVEPELRSALIESGTLLDCFDQRVKMMIDYLQQFEALKAIKLFVRNTDNYKNPWVIREEDLFKRLWKLELMYRKNIINEPEQILADTETIDDSFGQLDLFDESN